MANWFIHDIDAMKKSCALELHQSKLRQIAPAPYWFERVAVLSRKSKNYAQEIVYCEAYLQAVSELYTGGRINHATGVVMGPTHLAIENRLAQARRLLGSTQPSTPEPAGASAAESTSAGTANTQPNDRRNRK